MADSAITVPEFGWTSTKPECSAPYIVPALRRLLEGVPQGARVLDVGCGNGYNAARYLDWGFDVVGIDVSAVGLDIARRAYPAGRFEQVEICDDVLDRLGGAAPFDIVCSTEVVEHIYDPHAWARCCFNALAPGGALIASTPHHGFLKNLTISLANGWDRHFECLRAGGHIKFFSARTLAQLLRETGFERMRFIGAGRAPLLWKSLLVKAVRPE